MKYIAMALYDSIELQRSGLGVRVFFGIMKRNYL